MEKVSKNWTSDYLSTSSVRQCQLMGFQAVLIYLVLNFLLLKNLILRGLGILRIFYLMQIDVEHLQAFMLNNTSLDVPEHYFFTDGGKAVFSTWQTIKLKVLISNGFRRMQTFPFTFQHYSVLKRICILPYESQWLNYEKCSPIRCSHI